MIQHRSLGHRCFDIELISYSDGESFLVAYHFDDKIFVSLLG